MNFSLDAASAADATVLQNLFQLYTHDFSEFWAGTSKGELMANGRFPDYPLDPYFDAPGKSAFLCKADGNLAGFALVDDTSHSAIPADHSIAQFFILRKYRRSGLGLLAAQHLFQRYPGTWEVAVARKNTLALRFWREVIARFAAEGSLSELDLDGPDWNGPIIRFQVAM